MVRELRLTVVVEDSRGSKSRGLVAEHGLSFLLEVRVKGSKKPVVIMMDAGPSPEAMAHNIKELNLDVDRLDGVLLSHGHYDHVGGLLEVLDRASKQVLVVAHPALFDQKFVYNPALQYIGPSYTRLDLEARCAPLLVSNSVTIINGVTTTGEVERVTGFEKVEGFLNVEKEILGEDLFHDDQGLAVNMDGKGLVVLSGCAHSGIINTIRQAQKVTGVSEVYGVIGGFHLIKAKDERIAATVEELRRFDPKVIRPCHCTGSKAVKQLTAAFGDRCTPLKTGDIVRL